MSDLWKLTPRTKNKGKAYGSNVKNLQDLSNYFPDKTADDLFREIIDNSSVSIENSIDKWNDLSYREIIRLVKTMPNKEAIFKKILNQWMKYSLPDLVTFVNQREKSPVDFLRTVFIYIKNTYPGYFNNTIKSRWPNIESYL
jgi:hypothetical protein